MSKKYPGVKQRCTSGCSPSCRRHTWSWYAEIGTDPVTGKRIQLTGSGFDTAKEASEARTDAITRHRTEHTPVGDRRTPLAEYIAKWIDQQETDGALRPSTAAIYRRHLRLYVTPTKVGAQPVAKIGAHDIETLVRAVPGLAAKADDELRAKREAKRAERAAEQARHQAEVDARDATRNARRAEKGLPPLQPRSRRGPTPKPVAGKERPRQRTAGAVYALLSSALGYAERKKHISRNPCVNVEYRGSKSKRRADITWSMEQLRAFCRAALDTDLGELYVFAAMTGLRRGELTGLRWVDVDLDAGRLVVRKNRVVIDWQVAEGDVKSDAGEDRPIALDTTTVAMLKRLKTDQGTQRLALGEAWVNSGRVFVRGDGREWHPQTVGKKFTTFLAGLDLPRTTLHGLRHLSAMLGAEAGETLLQTSRRLGHSKISTTADIYGHVFEDVAQRAAERRGQLLQIAP